VLILYDHCRHKDFSIKDYMSNTAHICLNTAHFYSSYLNRKFASHIHMFMYLYTRKNLMITD